MLNLVCFVEEASAGIFLKIVVSRIFADSVNLERPIAFDGKQDLEKQLERKMRGWNKPNSVFLVMRDQDSGDCNVIKQKLEGIVRSSNRAPRTIIRIACRELESFYFGDLSAVEKGLGLSGLLRYQDKAKYRIPDRIENPSRELEIITGGEYQKILGSRLISGHLNLEADQNTSKSFQVLLDGLKRLIRENQSKK